MGSFLSRIFIMVLGYAYPAFECFKAVENSEPETNQLLFWCKYWILVAILTVCERVGDTLLSWLPLYSGAKLGFFIYLWYPKAKGTASVYDSFVRPYLKEHQGEIERSLLELKRNAGEISVIYLEKAVSDGKYGFYKILQYFSHQTKSKPDRDEVDGGSDEVFVARQEWSRKENISKEDCTESSGLFKEASGVHKRMISDQSVTETVDHSLAATKQDTGEIGSLATLEDEDGISGSSQKKEAGPRRRGVWRIFKICNVH
ncbi:hypothetical protein SLA2020_054780 [Shorea laevis]